MLRLDVRHVVRALGGGLKTGDVVRGVWSWGESRAAFSALLDPVTAKGIVVLNYSRNGVAAEERIRLEGTPCNYGGLRWWARCPTCPRRVAVLWGPTWRCRHCHGLAYGTSQLSKAHRASAAVRRIQARLGDDGSELGHGLWYEPERPKGMHQATYRKLVGKLRYAVLSEQLAGPKWLRAMIAAHGYG